MDYAYYKKKLESQIAFLRHLKEDRNDASALELHQREKLLNKIITNVSDCIHNLREFVAQEEALKAEASDHTKRRKAGVPKKEMPDSTESVLSKKGKEEGVKKLKPNSIVSSAMEEKYGKVHDWEE